MHKTTGNEFKVYPMSREIKPRNNNGSILIRFSYQGQNYTLSGFGAFTDRVALSSAKAVCSQIMADIASRNFNGIEKYLAKEPTIDKPTKVEIKLSALTLWDKWVETLNLEERTANGHYKYTRKWLEKYCVSVDDASWMINVDASSETWNRRKQYLSNCFNWGIENNLISINPYAKLKSRKQDRDRSKRKPFTSDEISRILQAFENSQHYNYYLDFVAFLLTAGVRPSEAIGLQSKHIDLKKKEITICQSCSRDEQGRTAGRHRTFKETKTGVVRVLSVPDSLIEILSKRVKSDPESLVFPSPTGLPIDDRMFLRRAWTKCLEVAEVEYRPPYTTRHTAASRMIEAGIPMTGVAYLLGHTDTTMVSRVYGHMINRPNVPALSLN